METNFTKKENVQLHEHNFCFIIEFYYHWVTFECGKCSHYNVHVHIIFIKCSFIIKIFLGNLKYFHLPVLIKRVTEFD